MRANLNPNRRFTIAIAVVLAWAMGIAAQAPTPVIRLGEVARALSDKDIADLIRTLPTGSKPWLLIGERGQSPVGQFVDAYLPAETSTREVRRGSMVPLRRNVRNAAAPEPWIVMDTNNLQQGRTGSYAQVLMGGRSFDQIQSDDDINRPFLIRGNPTDADLIAVVSVLRGSRANSYPGGGYVSGLPILTMDWQTNSLVVVDLRDGGILKQQRATLKKEGDTWRITGVLTGRA
jgi:hypothetical protein